MVKFGIEFVPQRSLNEILAHTVQAEKGGFEYVWVTDHFNNKNVYITLTLIASRTKTITLGPGVTNPYQLNPMLTAQAIASLNEIAPGRVVLGIGSGDRATLSQLGIERRRSLTAIRECVEIVRLAFTGKRFSFDGDIFKLKEVKFNFPTEGGIPIYIGAQGPKTLEMAGGTADGILINASHPTDIRYAVDHISKGAEEAGRKMSEIDVAAYAAFSIDDDAEKALKAAVPVVAFIVAGSPDFILERHGVDLAKAAEIREALGVGKFGQAFGLVTKGMAREFSICGTPEECLKNIEELMKIGVSQFVVGSPIGPDVKKSIDLVANQIIPAFRKRQ